ncbi:hypothetical protein VXN63_06015 [Marinilactibacillus sp. XAAS-LB27]|uniref:hypothetical protein n=1 Tax=Marinilactibacillus sp. XAAS-LB27 TaxID=3114538 RepID=UPI002E16EDA5|nr:hypothetical protein [Marinilactibacillus sp. XAAS-LB27]
MSSYQFIASDKPLPEVKNPYEEYLSINDMIKRKIKVDKNLLKGNAVNRNEKIVLYYPTEESTNELVLYKDQGYAHYAKEYSTKRFFTAIQWQYTEKRAEQLLGYLKEQLKNNDELEVWDIWLDDHEEAVVRTVKANQLSIADLAFLLWDQGFENPECLIIKK